MLVLGQLLVSLENYSYLAHKVLYNAAIFKKKLGTVLIPDHHEKLPQKF